jgi:hypothetical protein
MNHQGSVSLFSLLSFSQKDRRFPRAQVCRGGGGGMMIWTRRCSRKHCLAGKKAAATSCRKETNDKAKLPKLEQSNFYFQGYFP